MAKLSETIWQILNDDGILKNAKTLRESEERGEKTSGSAAEKTLHGGGEPFGHGKAAFTKETDQDGALEDNAHNKKAYEAMLKSKSKFANGTEVREEEDHQEPDGDEKEVKEDRELDNPRSGSAAEKTMMRDEEEDKEEDKKIEEEDDKKFDFDDLKKEEDDKEEDKKIEAEDKLDLGDLKEEDEDKGAEERKADEDKREMKAGEDELKEEEDKDEEEGKLKEEEDKEAEKDAEKVDVKEGLEAIFNGEKLSARFKEKLATIFESFVRAKVIEVSKKVEGRYNKKLEETKTRYQRKVAEAVSKHMDYATAEWLKENKVAVQTGLKVQIMESFLGGLKNLFENHYVEVPASKVDLVDA